MGDRELMLPAIDAAPLNLLRDWGDIRAVVTVVLSPSVSALTVDFWGNVTYPWCYVSSDKADSRRNWCIENVLPFCPKVHLFFTLMYASRTICFLLQGTIVLGIACQVEGISVGIPDWLFRQLGLSVEWEHRCGKTFFIFLMLMLFVIYQLQNVSHHLLPSKPS